jgi:acetate kinase
MRHILTLNAGSSSLKYGLYLMEDTANAAADPVEITSGKVERIGRDARIAPADQDARPLPKVTDHAGALRAVLAQVDGDQPGHQIRAVGHRIVHGGLDHLGPARLTPQVLDDLESLSPFAPLHQPHNIAGVRAAMEAFPEAAQIACFDTSFHRGHPFVNDTFALPRRFYEKGVRRYGFHGLSYEYIASTLAEIAPELHAGRVVVAHLGNGASMCALRGGKSVASTMGFSALDGLPMGTRSGQIDPGVILYLLEQEGMSPQAITEMLYKDSGLKGMSGISNDMRDLLASDNPHAGEALDYFTFRIRRELGALAAVLGGLDALVFCGGIGENAAEIRARVCAGMEWIGIDLDDQANGERSGAPRQVSAPEGRVKVMVIPTDEEIVIARAAKDVLIADRSGA